jgi:hypothetical protein
MNNIINLTLNDVTDSKKFKEEILQIPHELIHEDYTPENLDNFNEKIKYYQRIIIENGNINIIDNLLKIPEESRDKIRKKENDNILGEVDKLNGDEYFNFNPISIYHGDLDEYLIEDKYYRYIEEHPNTNIKIFVFNSKNSKNIPDIIKDKLKPVPDNIGYQFDNFDPIKYAKLKEVKYYLITALPINKKANLLAINMPYEIYSKIYSDCKLWNNNFNYDIDNNQYYIEKLANNDIKSLMSSAAGNGVNHPIAFYISDGVPYPVKGFRNLLFALHFKLPYIPVTLTITDIMVPTISLDKLQRDDIKALMNELCDPYFKFNI